MSNPKGYSTTQIALHWVIAVLIIANIVFGDAMGDAFDALLESGVAQYDLVTVGHIGAGVLVLLFAIWRLSLRLRRGVPPATGAGSAVTDSVAHVVHLTLYALMLAVPLVGAVAWFGAIKAAGELHEMAKPVFVILIAAHVAGALWHHFGLKDGLIRRMMRAED